MRLKIQIDDVGLKLDAKGVLTFCKYDHGFAASNLLITFDAEPEGETHSGRQFLAINVVATAWWLGHGNVQHFAQYDRLGIEATNFANEHCMDKMLQIAQDAHDEIRIGYARLVAA